MTSFKPVDLTLVGKNGSFNCVCSGFNVQTGKLRQFFFNAVIVQFFLLACWWHVDAVIGIVDSQ